MRSPFFISLSLLSVSTATPIVKRATSSSCPRYTLVNTRGTAEPQGESSGFQTMNSAITRQLSGGDIYNTVYAASFNQDSSAATTDIINKVTSTLQSDPDHCFILQGYSQGAAATVNALPRLTGDAFDAVKGLFLIGDPDHKSGLACNVDNNGGTTTRDVNGVSIAFSAGIPANWISKTLDVCIYVSNLLDQTETLRETESATLHMALVLTLSICSTRGTRRPKIWVPNLR